MAFELTIVTPAGEVYRGGAERVVLPGSEGQFGVMAKHERFLTPLQIGTIEIDTGSETIHAAIADGFAEVTGEQVAVLVDSCDLAADIDPAEAERLRAEAERALEGASPDEARYEAYESALELARAKVEASSRR